MARNFKVFTHRNDDQLHLKLSGDFDGSSAHELLAHIGKYCPKFTTIFIHTNCVKRLIPFGLGIFKMNFNSLDKKDTRIVFTGDNASRFSPETG